MRRIDELISAAIVPPLYRLSGRPYAAMQRELRAHESLGEEELDRGRAALGALVGTIF